MFLRPTPIEPPPQPTDPQTKMPPTTSTTHSDETAAFAEPQPISFEGTSPPLKPLPNPLTSSPEYQACSAVLFEWAESYDSKDWARLRTCVAPTLRIDYTSFLNQSWDAMPAADFVAMASSPAVLGSPTLRTQHMIGASRWEKTAPDLITGYHQLRVPHQRYADAACSQVLVKGHAHSSNTHWYRRVDGRWKFAGLRPDIRWSEYDFEAVFAAGREEMAAQTAERASGVPSK